MNSQGGQGPVAQGLIVSVLRDGGGDHSRGGLTAEHQELTVVNVDGLFGPADDRPAVMLIQAGAVVNPVLVPAVNEAGDWQPAPGWWMFGSNYAVSGDSRFGEALGRRGATRGMAPKVHDRIEASDVEVATTGSDGASVVIGTVRRRGMTWIALDQHGVTFSRHDSEAGAVETIEIGGVKR